LLKLIDDIMCSVVNWCNGVAVFSMCQSASHRGVTDCGWLCGGWSYRSLLHADVTGPLAAAETWCPTCRKLSLWLS